MKLQVCLPGHSFSAEFFSCFIRLTQWLIKNKITYVINMAQSYSIHEVRNKCLQGDYRKGPEQKPFNGDQYTHIVWLDSDIIFTPQHIEQLLASDKQVIGGLYRTRNLKEFAAGNIENFTSDVIKPAVPLTPEYIKDKPSPVRVDYLGFGACVMKQGVIENLTFPWFRPELLTTEIDGVLCSAIPTEDIVLFRSLAKKGIDAFVDSNVIVGHLKSFTI